MGCHPTANGDWVLSLWPHLLAVKAGSAAPMATAPPDAGIALTGIARYKTLKRISLQSGVVYPSGVLFPIRSCLPDRESDAHRELSSLFNFSVHSRGFTPTHTRSGGGRLPTADGGPGHKATARPTPNQHPQRSWIIRSRYCAEIKWIKRRADPETYLSAGQPVGRTLALLIITWYYEIVYISIKHLSMCEYSTTYCHTWHIHPTNYPKQQWKNNSNEFLFIYVFA